jgi:hypothetical protein
VDPVSAEEMGREDFRVVEPPPGAENVAWPGSPAFAAEVRREVDRVRAAVRRADLASYDQGFGRDAPGRVRSFEQLVGKSFLKREDEITKALECVNVAPAGTYAEPPKGEVWVDFATYSPKWHVAENLFAKARGEGVALPEFSVFPRATSWNDDGAWQDNECQTKHTRSTDVVLRFKFNDPQSAGRAAQWLNEVYTRGKPGAIGGNWETPDIRVFGPAPPGWRRAQINVAKIGDREVAVCTKQDTPVAGGLSFRRIPIAVPRRLRAYFG